MRFVDTSRIRTRFDERVPAADGTELSVDLYLPPEAGRYPIILNRTAADNNRSGRAGISMAPAERWKAVAAQGYIVAAADVRGRGDSDGVFVPFINELTDGAATVAWLRELPECNGKVGVFGSGYGAFCAWGAAVGDGGVDAIASISPFGAVGEGLLHHGGAVRMDWLFWMHLIAGRTVQPANAPPWPTIHRSLPLAAQAEVLGREDIWWRQWLEHLDSTDPFWSPLDLAQKIADLDVPGLHITGWWDGQVGAAHYYYDAALRSTAPQRLIVGPWDTGVTRRPASQVGGFDFGPRSVLDIDEVVTDFFDTFLRRRPSRCCSERQLFVTGRNEWIRQLSKEVVPGDQLTLYMNSGMGANTRRGDGVLTAVRPKDEIIDSLTHNPEVPVCFQPQFASFSTGANPLGFTLDQAHITARDEALVYTSAPFDAALTVMGRPEVKLMVRTDAADADIFVLLSDTFPLGLRDLHLSHAAIRLATLKSFSPGEWTMLQLQFAPVGHEFLEGHQLRLTITPSLYPLYARNLHAKEYTLGRQPVIATIDVRHGPETAGGIILPVRADYRGGKRQSQHNEATEIGNIGRGSEYPFQ